MIAHTSHRCMLVRMDALAEHPGRYEAILEELAAEFPSFRLVCKDESPFQRLIHGALMIVTAGQMRAYMHGYHTTLRRTVYVTPDWHSLDPDYRYMVLRHERVHLRQFRRFSLPGMALLYVLLPLPMGLAYFRARFEKEAYAETIRAGAELYGIEHVKAGAFRERILSQFTGASYGWMWPFPKALERWYTSVLEQIES